MTDTEKVLLYSKVLSAFGIDAQVFMVMEETGELLSALAKANRGRVTSAEIITELADVSIMMEQMAVYFGLDEFRAEKERKLQRLKERLEKHLDAERPTEGPTCRTCRFYENDCPYIRGKLSPYPSRACKSYMARPETMTA